MSEDKEGITEKLPVLLIIIVTIIIITSINNHRSSTDRDTKASIVLS